jgi:hypothetical protein
LAKHARREKTIFTTETPSSQRREAATEFRIISRKAAKGAKEKKKNLSALRVLGALAGRISESEMFRILQNLPKRPNFSSIALQSSDFLDQEFLCALGASAVSSLPDR